ncbi:hypothetical protein Tco_0675487 [Tanacetum coccineum]
MAAVNDVPQLVDKREPKTVKGDVKPESQWTPDERRVVIQDQRLKSIIMSCLPYDKMEYVISCVSVKETWTDLVHSFEGPLDTKENRIMDLKLEYQTFKAKSTESLSQTYTRYKTMLNELANDGVNLSKHEINVGFMNNIYKRFVYEDNLIQRRYSNTKKALITTPSSTQISTTFFSNNVIQDFQENSDDDVDEMTSEEYLRDLDIEYHERALLENSKRFIKRRNNFSDYKAEYKKMKAKLALLEASPSSTQNPNTFQPKNKGLVTETFNWDEEEVSDEEEVTQVKVLMALADDELTVGKSHARNDEWVDITMRKVNTLLSMDEDANWKNYMNQCISEQIPHQKKKVLCGELLTDSSSIRNENENLFVVASMGYDQEMVPKTKDFVKRLIPNSKLPYFNIGRILVPKSQAVNESLETSNTHESSKDSQAEFLTSLPPLKILQGALPSSEVLSLTFQPHSPKERPGLGIMKHTMPEIHDSSNESVSGTITVNESKQTTPSVPTEVKDTEQEILYCMICKREDHRTSDHEMYIASLKRSENYKAQSYQYASSSKQILRAKAKPFPPCTHYGFNDHIPDDCRNYPECGICGSYDHSTSGHNCVIQIRGGVLAESSQSNKSSIGVKCNTCRSTVPSTSDHNEFDYFKRGEKIQAANAREPTKKERIPNITYFHMFGCPMFIHNHKDHLGKFNAKADDRYFLGYSSVLKAFRIYNTRRQQIEETYHVTFDKSIEAIRFTNTSVDEIGIDDSSRYPPDELQEDDPSRQY